MATGPATARRQRRGLYANQDKRLSDGDPDAVPVLLVLLQDPEWDVRAAAAWWLERVRPVAKNALPALRKLQAEWDDKNYQRWIIDDVVARIEKVEPADEGRP